MPRTLCVGHGTRIAAGRNRSALPDSLFFALSSQGQACANKAAAAAKSPRPRKLSLAQESILLRAFTKGWQGHHASDCRSETVLVDRGLMRHTGGVEASRPTARYVLTEAGLAAARDLCAKRAAEQVRSGELESGPGRWREVNALRWERSDGAIVRWDDRSPYPNPERAGARMWTAWEPEPSNRYLGRKYGRWGAPRRWKTPEAAMRVVDRLHPLGNASGVTAA